MIGLSVGYMYLVNAAVLSAVSSLPSVILTDGASTAQSTIEPRIADVPLSCRLAERVLGKVPSTVVKVVPVLGRIYCVP